MPWLASTGMNQVLTTVCLTLYEMFGVKSKQNYVTAFPRCLIQAEIRQKLFIQQKAKLLDFDYEIFSLQ